MFEDLDALFESALTFDYLGQFQALSGFGSGHHFIVTADSALPWAWCSKTLDRYRIAHTGRPLADGSCLFTVSEEHGEKAERILEMHGASLSHPILDELGGVFT